jgi:methylthioribose-1-phosphate isomerase
MTTDVNSLLPYLLRRENVARYQDGVVLIGDRRKYPFEKAVYPCHDVETVAQAIEGMVTQGGGPWLAAALGMALAAREVAGQPDEKVMAHMEKAAARLTNTRPTNTALARRLEDAVEVVKSALGAGEPVEKALLDWVEGVQAGLEEKLYTQARFAADLIDDGDGVLTMCFAEAGFILTLALAHQQGKQIQVYTPETRPFLQGARLTAPCVHELGIPVKVVTDNMPAYLMSQGRIQKYFTAADLITLDGHVVNKIGTFQNAIAASYHGIPYFAYMWMVDHKSPDRASIVIEERDPAEIKSCRGTPTTLDEIDAYYPAFDITPPHLVAGVITVHGILSPYDLVRHYT